MAHVYTICVIDVYLLNEVRKACDSWHIAQQPRCLMPMLCCSGIALVLQVLQAFQNEADVKVLLISLKAGGVALNLTVANHIFLMDP